MKLLNLARMTTATTGTGAIALGAAVAGYLTFAQAGIANNDVVSYAIIDGANSEVGRGTYSTTGPTLTRTTVLKSTNSDTAISLSGNAQVFITALAEDIIQLNSAGAVVNPLTLSAALTYGGVTLSNAVTGTGNMVLSISPSLTGTVTTEALRSTTTLGYGTGAGGSVTQTTSRTTAVTINKMCGTITLFNTAASPTATTFTVNNNLVAATDVILIHAASGLGNLYHFIVTAVAAGSFNLTFYSTGGTVTDSPVLNFVVIKGVTS